MFPIKWQYPVKSSSKLFLSQSIMLDYFLLKGPITSLKNEIIPEINSAVKTMECYRREDTTLLRISQM